MIGAIRILVADDHTLVRESLVAMLAADPELAVVAQAADGVEALALAESLRPDVAIVDISMPRLNGIEVVRRLRAARPATRVLALTMHPEDDYVLQMVQAGAAGYLVKDSAIADLIAAVKGVHAGQAWFGPQAARALSEQAPGSAPEVPHIALTPREREVFGLIVDGHTTKEIAKALGISVKTAENHRLRVLAKLGLRNSAELVRYAARHGLLDCM